MIQPIQTYFFRYGWLLPAWLPIILLFGRAAQNIFLGLYSLWGCVVLYKSGGTLEKKWVLLWLSVLVAFSFSIVFAENPQLAFRKWLQIVSHMLAFLLVLVTITSSSSPEQKMHRFLFFLGIGGILGLLGLYLKLFIDMLNHSFQPTRDMIEDYLPLLLPFMLYFVGNLSLIRWVKSLLSILLVSIVGFYVIYSDGRAAILGFCLVLLSYGCLVLKLRFYQVGVTALVLLSTIVLLNPSRFTRGAEGDLTWETKLSKFTSGRSELWLDAVHHPPPSLLTGAGIGHLKHVSGIAVLKNGEKARDFHNFVLNVWYETGLIGLTAWLCFIFWPILNILRRWHDLHETMRKKAGILLSASIAVLIAGLLTPSHFSLPFTFYLPILLAGLVLCRSFTQLLYPYPMQKKA